MFVRVEVSQKIHRRLCPHYCAHIQMQIKPGKHTLPKNKEEFEKENHKKFFLKKKNPITLRSLL